MIILSAAALVIFTFMAIINVLSFLTNKKPDYVGATLNFIVGVICINGIGVVYDQYKLDMKVFNDVSSIQRTR